MIFCSQSDSVLFVGEVVSSSLMVEMSDLDKMADAATGVGDTSTAGLGASAIRGNEIVDFDMRKGLFEDGSFARFGTTLNRFPLPSDDGLKGNTDEGAPDDKGGSPKERCETMAASYTEPRAGTDRNPLRSSN